MNVLSLDYTIPSSATDYMTLKNAVYNYLIHPFFTSFDNVTYLRAETLSGETKHVYSIAGFNNLFLCVYIPSASGAMTIQINTSSQTTTASCLGSAISTGRMSVSYGTMINEGSLYWVGDEHTLRGITAYATSYSNMILIGHGSSGNYIIQNTSVFDDASVGVARSIFSTPSFSELEKLLFSKAVVVYSNNFIDIIPDVYRFSNTAFSNATSYLLIDIGGTRYRQVAPYLFIAENES